MSNAKQPWSPGPWEVEKLNPQQVRMKGGICVAFASEGVIAGAGGTYRIDHAEAKANARLIAAAPELVNAVRAFRDAIDTLPSDLEPVDVRDLFNDLVYFPILARVEGGGEDE